MLQLAFNLCPSDNCKALIFHDITGVYDGVTNPNGYGAPNDDVTTATSATLTITYPQSTGSATLITVVINLFSSFPSTNSNQGWMVFNTDLGLTGTSQLPSGEYDATYTIVTNGNTYTQTIKQFVFCNLECCVANKFASITDVTCDCSKSAINDALTAFSYLVGLCYAEGCGNSTVVNNYFTALNDICNNTDCGCH